MQTLTRKPKQLSLTLALAVLAIGALVAVALIAGGNPAQATAEIPVAQDDAAGHERPLQVDHATPEPCPGEEGNVNELKEVVSTGHIALFDVHWTTDEEELEQTFCPPTVTHVEAVYDERTGDLISPARDDRAPSSINFEQTIIHIPNSARIDLNAADTPFPAAKYPALWHADGLETRDTDGDGVDDVFADRKVWFLPACPPDGNAGTDDLCIAFSAALLNPADWIAPPESDAVTVDFRLDHIHQTDIDRQDPRYVLTYDHVDPPRTLCRIPTGPRSIWGSARRR